MHCEASVETRVRKLCTLAGTGTLPHLRPCVRAVSNCNCEWGVGPRGIAGVGRPRHGAPIPDVALDFVYVALHTRPVRVRAVLVWSACRMCRRVLARAASAVRCACGAVCRVHGAAAAGAGDDARKPRRATPPGPTDGTRSRLTGRLCQGRESRRDATTDAAAGVFAVNLDAVS